MIKKLQRKRDKVVSRSMDVGIGKDRPSSGFGNIIIPSDVDRGEYVNYSYRTGTCMIVTSFNDVYKGVRVPKHVLESITFPDNSGEYGSLVSWVNTPKINQVTLTGILVSPKEIYQYGENSFGRNRNVEDNTFGESLRVSKDSVNYSMGISNSFSNDGGMAFSAIGFEGNVSSLDLNLDGTSTLYSDQLTDIRSYDEVNITVGTDDDENKSLLSIKNTGILEYTDFNGNFLKIEEGKITLESKDGEIIHGDGATEAAMLGDKTKTELTKLSTRVDLLYQAIQGGVVVAQDGGASLKSSMVAILAPAVSEDYANILSTVNKIK